MPMYQKLLHWLEIRLMHSTCYAPTPLTTRRFFYHLLTYYLHPFKQRGWFGWCDYCGKFTRGLERQVVDVDYCNDDPDGPTVLPIHGMVCENCYYQLENERW